jgi:cytidylate kinase
MKTFTTVAMDGGAATGKSSSSKIIAEKYNFMHVDTGSHYRTITRALIDAGFSINDLTTSKLPHKLRDLNQTTTLHGRTAQLVINSRPYSSKDIRCEEVNNVVSDYAAQPAIRTYLLQYQRDQVQIAREKNFAGLIMEGRDIGSIVLPDADLRFFLHADLEARKMRRAREGIADEVEKRDQMDSSRKVAPLKCADGAISIDSGILNLEEVVEHICKYIERIKG